MKWIAIVVPLSQKLKQHTFTVLLNFYVKPKFIVNFLLITDF